MVKVQLVKPIEGYEPFADLKVPAFLDHYLDEAGFVHENYNSQCDKPALVLTPLKAWRDADRSDIEAALDGKSIEAMFGDSSRPKKCKLVGGYNQSGEYRFLDKDEMGWKTCKVYK